MDPASLEFARPLWLLAGAVLCALAVALWVWFDRRREADLARLVHARFRARLLPGLSKGLLWTKRSLWLAGSLLLCTAAAGPRFGYEWREVRQRGIDLLFAVDTSKSMLAEDLSPNRLERARMGIQDFVDRLRGDRVGLIPFAGSSFAMCLLTNDYDAFRQSLRMLNTDIIPRQGTDVASAIREAKRLFDEQNNSHRILILMTDGEDFQEDVEAAVEEAKKDNMKVYTIGVASPEGGKIPDGSGGFVRDESGREVITKLGEDMLRKTAEATGALYAPLGRGAEGLEMIYQEKLRLMPRQERDSSMAKIPLERYSWPLAAGLLLLLVEFLLPDRRREARAKALPSAARRHAATTALVVILAGISSSQLRAEENDPRTLYNEGTAAYEAGDFSKAKDCFQSSLKTTDLKLQSQAYYNLGNAHYRTGQALMQSEPDKVEEAWKSAVKAYEDTLALNPADEDARHNRDLVQRKLDGLKKQKDKKGQNQKDDQEKKDEGKKDDQQKQEQKDQKEQEQKDQQKQDQQNQEQKDQQKQDGQSRDQQQQGQDGQEKKDGQPQQPQDQSQNSNGDKKGQQQQQGEKKDQSAESGKEEKKEEQTAGGQEKEDEQKPGDGEDKKDGVQKEDAAQKKAGDEKKAGEQKDGEPKTEDGEQTTASQRRKPGEMTAEEARQLLKTMRMQEASVLPAEQQAQLQQQMRERRYGTRNTSTKGKTW